MTVEHCSALRTKGPSHLPLAATGVKACASTLHFDPARAQLRAFWDVNRELPVL
jgi:hypothetical protein